MSKSARNATLHYTNGMLRAAAYIANKFDEPTMAAGIIKDELIDAGFISLTQAKKMAKDENLNLNKVWKESYMKKK